MRCSKAATQKCQTNTDLERCQKCGDGRVCKARQFWMPDDGERDHIQAKLGLYVIPLAIIRHPELTGLADAPIAALLTTLQIGVGLALLGRGLTAPHVLPVRAALIAAGMVVIFLRTELFAA